jgi:carbamoyltransferase
MDLAASIQAVTEEILLRAARHAHQVTSAENLVLAGGVALNCVANGRIAREGPFERIWIQPAAGDAGGALGAALFVWYQLLDKPRKALEDGDYQKGSLLGPGFEESSLASFLDSVGASYRAFESEEALAAEVAELLAAEQVVGHVEGRMEFGPRALGGRSILGDARSPRMQSVMNLKIKFRESFRPFAPAVLREEASSYFEMRSSEESPYMLLVAPLRSERRLPADGNGARGLDKLREPRSVVPAITHVDYSARVQTVDRERNPRFHLILAKFRERTGCPILINTSFNVRGEPIVCTPEDAYRCFMATNIDALVLGRFLLIKEDQPRTGRVDAEGHLARFELD